MTVMAALLGAGVASAQQSAIGNLNPLSEQPGGIRLYSVSIFGAYYSGGLPLGLPGGVQPSNSSTNQDPTGVTGVSASLGWSRNTGRSSLSAAYSGAFITEVPSWETALNNSFSTSLSGSRQITPRLRLSYSVNGNLTSTSTFLFTPTQLSAVAAAPATFDELSTALLGGTVDNPALASALTGTTADRTPLQALFYGYRTASAGAQVALSYNYSPRLVISVNGGASRMQHLDSSADGSGQGGYVIPQSTSAQAGVSLAYAWSPQTQIGLSLATSRAFSRLEDEYSSTASAFIGRSFSRRWFVRGSAGAGMITPLRNTYQVPRGAQYSLSGSIGFKTRSHTFLAEGSRSVADTYGFGASGTVSAVGSWSWSRPGSGWSLFASAGKQWLTGAGFSNLDSWQASAGFSRRLDTHFTLRGQYSYMTYSNQLVGVLNNLNQSGVFLALVWSPQPRIH